MKIEFRHFPKVWRNYFLGMLNRYLVGVYMNRSAHEKGECRDLMILGNTGLNKVKPMYFRTYTTSFPAYHTNLEAAQKPHGQLKAGQEY